MPPKTGQPPKKSQKPSVLEEAKRVDSDLAKKAASGLDAIDFADEEDSDKE